MLLPAASSRSPLWLLALFTLLPRRFAAVDARECSVTWLTTAGERTAELSCTGEPPFLWDFESIPEKLSVLSVHGWENEELDPVQLLADLPHLRNLSIEGGKLLRIVRPFPKNARNLEVVEIRGTGLRELTSRVFSDLPLLRSLDLRNNSLSRIDPDELIAITSLTDVYLSGNQWPCDESWAWLTRPAYGSLVRRLADREELRCAALPHKGRPLLFVVEVMQRLREECQQLDGCECELVYVASSGVLQAPAAARQRQFMAFASVNCSHRGFTDMPAFLPANTTALHLEGNQISDLTPLKSNPAYKGVLDLYLDDNAVESVALLDGSYWLEHFRLLSLRGNKMTDFPTYALENVLPHSESAVSLYLGNNPWRCDCQFTPGFQELLIKYGNLVKDVADVRCAAVGNGEFTNKQIRELSRTEICVPTDDGAGLSAPDVLSILFAILLLLLLGKFLYDYWSYKRTGKLPWLSGKLPAGC